MSVGELGAETEPKSMTFEEFMALPEDGTDRELVRGILKIRGNKGRGMTIRNRNHSRIEAIITKVLGNWLDTRPEPRGEVVCGEAGFRLRGTKDSGVGIDVAYASADLVAATPEGMAVYNGPPVLAVEILSPSDTHQDVVEKIEAYTESGTVTWVVNPDFRTIVVHRPGEQPIMLNNDDELSGEPYLPGFRTRVSKLFG